VGTRANVRWDQSCVIRTACQNASTKYVVESAGQYVRRFVELPNGRKIPLPTRKAQPCACVERVSIIPEQAADAKSLA
jgi:hypothetical protein